MIKKIHNILLIFFLILLSTSFFLPIMAKGQYGVKHHSLYIWDVKEEIGEQIVEYQLTAVFNLNNSSVNVTKYFYANESVIHSTIQMNRFGKYLKASNEIIGTHNYFYTGPGTLKFPRHVVIVEDDESTQVTDYETGIILYFTSDSLQHELINGTIPISWIVWIIVILTISLCGFSIIFLYRRSRSSPQTLIYKIS
ncbi:MAG: hypothetical protein ACFFD2_13330 [Promethearchaeota archaeon]